MDCRDYDDYVELHEVAHQYHVRFFCIKMGGPGCIEEGSYIIFVLKTC